MKNKIQTHSLESHKRLFDNFDNKDYFYFQSDYLPYSDDPYRAESYVINFLRKGSVIIQYQLEKVALQAPAILAFGPSVMRNFIKDNDEIAIDVLFFKPEFFLESQANVFFLTAYSFFENYNIFKLNQTDKTKFEQLFHLIKNLLENDTLHQSSTLRSYLYILIYELDNLSQLPATNKKSNILYENFKVLLSRDFIRCRTVDYYAGQLNVTRKYLSDVVKKSSGKTAGKWITEMVILESKVLLHDKKTTIAQISEILHFESQSGFARFFKNNTGVQPSEFRNGI